MLAACNVRELGITLGSVNCIVRIDDLFDAQFTRNTPYSVHNFRCNTKPKPSHSQPYSNAGQDKIVPPHPP